MNTILVLVPCYLPGYKFGGPVRSISNLIDHLADRYAFRVVTSDRDIGDRSSYDGVRSDEWNPRENCRVYYASPSGWNLPTIASVIGGVDHDVLYINGIMNRSFSVYPLLLRRLNRIPSTSTLVAPRGQFSSEALRLKYWKKYPYLYLAGWFGLFKGVHWHATSREEEREIQAWVSEDDRIHRAGNFPLRTTPGSSGAPRKEPGRLQAVFLSRIVPKKNLDVALNLLRGLDGDVHFSIYGPVGDREYWRRCQEIIGELSGNITVQYRGPVEPHRVVQVLSEHHLFFLPTRNENHGHVIREALQAGCPVLISDRTPFKDLGERGAGWVHALEDREAFRRRLREARDMDEVSLARMRDRARQVVRAGLDVEELVRSHVDMFEALAGE